MYVVMLMLMLMLILMLMLVPMVTAFCSATIPACPLPRAVADLRQANCQTQPPSLGDRMAGIARAQSTT
jgi:hypothetical protein